MHFVCGGAFQGKKKWVKSFYKLDDEQCRWFNGYSEPVFPDLNSCNGIVIIEGIEMIIQSLGSGDTRQEFRSILEHWMDWLLSSEQNKLIIIGCEIGMGIVPLEKENRVWRDIVGWCYQDIAARASRVDKVWCGLAERLK
ncbi:bifunctional adenosylcobinamide kinase/adenosylcobinamide-phosphate guanylyltransferase [Metabacillus fastidiosus]|uniref:bifunctional adenosylcobinamide kinase/adenosylcobinamide-phosphate guanylyltransferase n=1 Tax=Metabacillus fastidiosus TaxID=1458 RepID=UPI002E1BCF13|nr:bifunctional adenosylcobinamide kinase/adenosylcobinamide-phosphate guanylyltransferase [Metabacillus fastidiosus]MED4532235.1 bifunctional adenosylcobinamide kinase/adenosylcobinamide-phosphate guanylyltransferase [Metabacillus fastidiosus]